MRFDQVKLAAHDPERLAAFYVSALGCVPVRPLTRLPESVSPALGAPDSVVELTMLRLPVAGAEHGPRLELYRFVGGWPPGWRHLPGTGQLAFWVDDVDAAARSVLGEGGSRFGEIVDWVTPGGVTARFGYFLDPEGNIVDLWTS